VNTGGIAALSLAFATYLGYFIPLDPAGIRTAAITGLLLVTFLNVRGVKIGGIFSDVFTLLKLCGILFLILVGLGGGSIGRIDLVLPAIDGRLAGAGALAMVGVLWSYGGWQHASFAAAEAKNPERSVPVAMVTGAVVVVTVYLLTNVAYLMLLPVNQIGLSSRVAAEAMQSVLGPAAGGIIAAAIFVSTFGTAGIYTMTAPRIYFAMAQDGVFFRRVAGIHPRYGTPAFAIVLQTGWAILLVLFWGTFENLISYVVFTDWIFFALAGASVFVFRRRRPAADRPYRTFGYPVTPLFFVGIAVWFVANTIITKPGEAGAGIAFLALGVPVFYFWRRRSQSTHSHDKVKHP
jgi:APA family basic amino acid/polyamine antiporter